MRNDRIRKINTGFLCLFLCALMTLLPGCGMDLSGTKVVLTTGLNKDEVFRIETISCSRPEMMVYLTNIQNQYENVYGTEIWATEADGTTLEERVKDNALAKMAQVKTMNLMAQTLGIELTADESKSVENAADIYYDSLSRPEIDGMGIDRDTIASLYREYLIARKVYEHIIADVNPEISDDEARNITVEYILIKTYTTDATGRRVEMSSDEARELFVRAEEAHDRAVAGESFDSLVAEYSDSDEMIKSLGKEDLDNNYLRTALFDLANGEISEVLTTEDGYLVALCLSTYNLEETDLNKIEIVERERETIFGEQYDAYVQNLTRKLNDQLWSEIEFLHGDDITTSDFFTVADDNLILSEQ